MLLLHIFANCQSKYGNEDCAELKLGKILEKLSRHVSSEQYNISVKLDISN